ncbi:MAG: hypothetical protein WDM90_15385 [Ferruginibacter sp.]
MYGGDRSRKLILVDYGFRLPSALDNRPLNFHEFEALTGQTIFVSATRQIMNWKKAKALWWSKCKANRFAGPPIEIRPSINQIDDLLDEIDKRIKKGDRVLVTTLTKRMAEEMTKYLERININVNTYTVK